MNYIIPKYIADFDAGVGARGVNLTKPELEFLSEHFDGANDPTAAAILEKVRDALRRT